MRSKLNDFLLRTSSLRTSITTYKSFFFIHLLFLVLILLSIGFDIIAINEQNNGGVILPIGPRETIFFISFNFPYGIYGGLSEVSYYVNILLTGLIIFSLIGFPILSLRFFDRIFSHNDLPASKYHFFIGILVTSLVLLVYGIYYVGMDVGIINPVLYNSIIGPYFLSGLNQAVKDYLSFIGINIFMLIVFSISFYLTLKYFSNKIQLERYHFFAFIGMIFFLCFSFNLVFEIYRYALNISFFQSHRYTLNISFFQSHRYTLNISFFQSLGIPLLLLIIFFCFLMVPFGLLIVKSKNNALSYIFRGVTITVLLLSLLTHYVMATTSYEYPNPFPGLVFYLNHLNLLDFNTGMGLLSELIDVFLRPYFINLLGFYALGYVICPSIIYWISKNKIMNTVPTHTSADNRISSNEAIKIVSTNVNISTPITLIEETLKESYQAPDYETALKIQQGGFPDYTTYKQALDRGIMTYAEWIKNQKKL